MLVSMMRCSRDHHYNEGKVDDSLDAGREMAIGHEMVQYVPVSCPRSTLLVVARS